MFTVKLHKSIDKKNSEIFRSHKKKKFRQRYDKTVINH